jgi:hypothetical protein
VRVSNYKDYIGGWFLGQFSPTALRTPFEVAMKLHPKGELWPAHYHLVATEINLLWRGRMRICGQELEAGAVFVIEPGEVAAPEFLEDCEVLVVKYPAAPNDKVVVP